MSSRKKKRKEGVSKDVDSSRDPTQSNNENIPEEILELRKIVSDMESNYLKLMEKHKQQLNSESKVESKNPINMFCKKFSNSECLFDFVVYKDGIKVETYFVQLFNQSNKCQIGRLKMPMGLDMQRVLSETPLNNFQDASKFLKNLKRYIQCFQERKKQFDDLKVDIKDSVNCFIETNYNYSYIVLQFMDIYNSESDVYHNILVYLFYDLGEERPEKIKFDSKDGKRIDEQTSEYLKELCNCFEDSDLKEGFKTMFLENETPLKWKLKFQKDVQNSLNELDSSESEEEETTLRKKKSANKNAKSIASNKPSNKSKNIAPKKKKKPLELQGQTKLNFNKTANKSLGESSQQDPSIKAFATSAGLEKIGKKSGLILTSTPIQAKPKSVVKKAKTNLAPGKRSKTKSKS